eukprot:6188066-Pleurochrysis_carterae.AAC.3
MDKSTAAAHIHRAFSASGVTVACLATDALLFQCAELMMLLMHTTAHIRLSRAAIHAPERCSA